jgi:hypothetical protein
MASEDKLVIVSRLGEMMMDKTYVKYFKNFEKFAFSPKLSLFIKDELTIKKMFIGFISSIISYIKLSNLEENEDNDLLSKRNIFSTKMNEIKTMHQKFKLSEKDFYASRLSILVIFRTKQNIITEKQYSMFEKAVDHVICFMIGTINEFNFNISETKRKMSVCRVSSCDLYLTGKVVESNIKKDISIVMKPIRYDSRDEILLISKKKDPISYNNRQNSFENLPVPKKKDLSSVRRTKSALTSKITNFFTGK